MALTTKFKARSFDEYSKPFQMYAKVYRELEDALSALQLETAQWEKKLNATSDPVAAKLYQGYIDALKSLINTLTTEGLSPASRQGLLNMRTRYASEINPIKEAFERRRVLADEQRKLFSNNQSLRFSNDWSKALITLNGKLVGTIDALMSNPELSYESLSGNDIALRTASMAKNLATAIVNDPTYTKVLGGQYFQLKLQQGYTPEQIVLEATGDSNAPAALKKIRESITNLIKGNAAYDKDWADSYINQGMYSAIGSAKYDLVKNGEYIDAAQRKSLAMQRERLDFEKEQARKAEEAKKEAEALIPMSDGNFYDPKTGTIRDKDKKIIANPKGGAVSKTTGGAASAEGYLPFTSLDYTNGNSFDDPGSTDKFSKRDAKKYDPSNLTPKARKKLERDLLPYGLTINDVDIYEDYDFFSNSHYRVVPKNNKVEVGDKWNDANTELLDFN